MAVNKVIYGGKTVIDLTADTVTSDTLAKGTTAHNAKGEQITGTMESGGGGGGATIATKTVSVSGVTVSSIYATTYTNGAITYQKVSSKQVANAISNSIIVVQARGTNTSGLALTNATLITTAPVTSGNTVFAICKVN